MFEKISLIVVGALIGWILQQYRVMRSEDTAQINEHIKDIEKFRDVAQDYWLKLLETPNDVAAASAKVRAAQAATTIPYTEIVRICASRSEEYKLRSLELFECATGGEFESPRRVIDAERAIKLYDSAAELVQVLRATRRSINSFRGVFEPLTMRWKSYSTRSTCPLEDETPYIVRATREAQD